MVKKRSYEIIHSTFPSSKISNCVVTWCVLPPEHSSLVAVPAAPFCKNSSTIFKTISSRSDCTSQAPKLAQGLAVENPTATKTTATPPNKFLERACYRSNARRRAERNQWDLEENVEKEVIRLFRWCLPPCRNTSG
jgi:hypothetical protein